MISSRSITLLTVCVGVLLLVDTSSAYYGPKPRWNSRIAPLKLKNEAECERLRTILRESIGQFLEKRKFNSIDDFVEFHDSYTKYMEKKSPSQTVSTFYRYFTPKIQKCEIFAYLVDDLIPHILSNSPVKGDPSFRGISASIYRVSVEKLTPKTLGKSLDSESMHQETIKMFDVMACIKLLINQKTAYILMDPTHGSPDPILVLHTTKPFEMSTTGITEFVNNKVEYNTMSTDQNYVYTRYYDNSGNPVPALVCAGFRFLSLKDCTQKPSLLDKFRAIIKRNKNGQQIASVHFNAVPAVQNIEGKDTSVATFTVSWNGKTITLPFKNLKAEKGTLQQSIGEEGFNIIQGATGAMDLQNDQLVEKIKAAGRAMENIEFLRDIQKLDEEMNSMYRRGIKRGRSMD